MRTSAIAATAVCLLLAPCSGSVEPLTPAESRDAATTRIAAGGVSEPNYSPDGRRIVFASNASGNLRVMISRANGKNPKGLTDPNQFNGGPTW